ncbi:hypothetical protein D3C80_1589540 [compost metagenome]
MVAACLHIGIAHISSILVDGDNGDSVTRFRKSLRDPGRNLTAQKTVNSETASILFALLQQLEQTFLLLLHAFERHVQEGKLILIHHTQITLRAYRPHQLPEGP